MQPDKFYRRMMVIGEELRGQGLSKWNFAPPLYRLMWRAGWKVRPPLYQGFWRLALLTGGSAAIFWMLSVFWPLRAWVRWCQSMGFPTRVRGDVDLLPVVGVSGIVFGVLMGLSAAIIFRRRARGLRLPQLEALE